MPKGRTCRARRCWSDRRHFVADCPHRSPSPMERSRSVVVTESEPEAVLMRPRETPRYRGQGLPEPFSTKNLSLQFSVQEGAMDQDIQILTDRRYEGIPIVSQSFVAKGGLQVWEGPEVCVAMMQGVTFTFKQYALLSVVYQCKGYYGRVAIASDQSPFYENNGWICWT